MTANCVFCGHRLTPDQATKWGAYCSKHHYDRETTAVRRLRLSSPLAVTSCEQPGCTRAYETWCPLCGRMLCLEHDPLTPIRMHDCLKGPAETLLANREARS